MNKPTAIDLLQDNGALSLAFIRAVLEDCDLRLKLTRILSYQSLYGGFDDSELIEFMREAVPEINSCLEMEANYESAKERF